jgi:hypothetical protein
LIAAPVPFKSGVAELTLIAYCGFTVGAWIASRQIALELGLVGARGAPRGIRDLRSRMPRRLPARPRFANRLA